MLLAATTSGATTIFAAEAIAVAMLLLALRVSKVTYAAAVLLLALRANLATHAAGCNDKRYNKHKAAKAVAVVVLLLAVRANKATHAAVLLLALRADLVLRCCC